MRGVLIGAVLGAAFVIAAVGAATGFAKDKPPGPCYVSTAAKDYPGDDAPSADIARWMAAGAVDAGLPPELPVMAALVHSELHNLPAGDADSVGFFQMRVGIWDRGEYAGFPDHPELQLQWFLDHAIAVKTQRVSAGQSTTDPAQYGDWVADVERPAEPFRGRYQLRLDEARALLLEKPKRG